MERANTTKFKFFSLGGSNEVGRSCHVLQYKGKTVMLDAGIHPAYQGLASLPFYDEFDLSKIDILLISHFHLDHAASLPYVMQRTNFQGRVFMTHPTKAIYRWLLRDFVRVTSIGSSSSSMGGKDESLFSDEDLVDSFDKIETVDYHSTVDVNGIKFTAFHAGHVLGAAMFQIEIAGLRVLFTGDYSREVDRHLNSAEVPPLSSNVLIVESTFGTATHEPRLNREKKLTQLIHSTVMRGGRVLLPVFALGRAQEIMLILDEYWSQHTDELGGGQVPIFYASNLAKKCMSVFQTYVNMMNDDIRKKFRDSQTNPFIFKNISYLRNLEDFQDFGPSVMLASPGMLQSGLSRDLLERWCPEDKNLVLITGYSIEGTMAKFIMLEPDTIPSINNPEITIPRRCQVEEISFAAHVDFQENLEFIEKISAPNIILVHGEANPMGRLKSALLSNFVSLKGTESEVHVFNPRNCVEVDLEFQGVKVAKAVGNIVNEIYKEEAVEVKEETAAKIEPIKEETDNELNHQNDKDLADDAENRDIVVSGILVSDDKNFELDFLSLSDLREHHPDLSTTILRERQSVRVNCKKELIYWHILQMFGEADVLQDDDKVTNQEPKFKQEENNGQIGSGKLILQIMGDIKLTVIDTLATLEWTQDLMTDTVADSIVAILMNVDSAPASVKLSSHSCDDHDHNDVLPFEQIKMDEVSRVKQISRLFKEQFGECFTLFLDKNESSISKEDTINGVVTIGKNTAKIDFINMKILECNSNPLKGRVESLLNIGSTLVTPLC
ncbi:ysh1p [Saccharomyces arboricola H-6]|uniref:Endoribonuclease YSH1 n=1 Tax=Saccharomyces arboricola (strain H-6 / AS 2.3317 / CBS 10644) TaxID=1160507 RepID=J8LKF4_SACAR|nr:ysh1p [Saccharomyces arboricola H-6]